MPAAGGVRRSPRAMARAVAAKVLEDLEGRVGVGDRLRNQPAARQDILETVENIVLSEQGQYNEEYDEHTHKR